MKPLRKAPCLAPGDTVATVSLSSGLAGDAAMRWRYQQGKRRIEELFGLKVVEMPHTLAGSDYLYEHPEARAQDLMDAFAEPSIKAVISCTGGDDSIRLHPYMDYEVLANNPKLYSGFSDSTVTHLMCLKAGLSSLYGPSVLSDFAENVAMCPYTAEWTKRLWFSPEAPGTVPTSPTFSGQYLEWAEENAGTARAFEPNTGYHVVQGGGAATGPLIGGCFEILDLLRGTALFPDVSDFEGAVLFLETSEECPPAWVFSDALRALASMGVLERLAAILFAKPLAGRLQADYHDALRRVLAECRRQDMPVLGNASFGHNEPRFPLPYGAAACVNCAAHSFTILEGGVT